MTIFELVGYLFFCPVALGTGIGLGYFVCSGFIGMANEITRENMKEKP